MYSNFCLVFFFIFSLFHPIPCASSKLKWCETLFQCGNIIAGFPFWGGNRPEPCGHPLLELHCNLNITSLIISNQEYHVFHLNQTSNTLTLARPDLLGPFCSAKFITTTFLSEVFALPETYKSLTVYYRCNPQLHYLSSYTCPDSGLVAVSQNPDYQYSCQNSFTVNVPTSFVPKGKKLNLTHLEIILRKGFDLKVVIDEKACQKCSSFRGVCSFDSTKQVCCNVTLESGVKCSQLYPPTAGELYRRCSALFSCGNQDKILYPFWIPGREECGHPDFQLNCSGGFAELSIASVKFRILEANYTSRIIRLARSDYSSNLCPINPLNVPINEKVLPLAHDTELLTLYYDCPDYSSEFLYSGCIEELGCVNHKKSYYVTKNISIVNSGSLNKLKGLCRRNVSIPASGPALVTLQRIPTPDNLKMALEEGFELGVNQECLMCIDSGGACGYNQTSSVFVCYCKNGSHNRSCYLKADGVED
ncbi:LEAF RUST 10 DISEASE-RESISTANCE LOCUS RECEPTOR-LIKE PROTEIN KINASE-like 2.7 [Cardamine amara subsp. amara]|uniref:non-specific serine/threonine protein kinase n=1 Tax=Cardamine amara subsp. amara TaxID=228776 RepID=A0ABD0ZCJ4_CARAN